MSPKVDFYILDSSDEIKRSRFICNLIEKAYLEKYRLFAYCPDKMVAEALDESLWTFRPDSFVPHHLQGEGPTPPPPIEIGTETPSAMFQDILLNLSPFVPEFYYKFKHVIEVVDASDDAKTLARTRYRHYQTQSCIINTQHIHLHIEEPLCDA